MKWVTSHPRYKSIRPSFMYTHVRAHTTHTHTHTNIHAHTDTHIHTPNLPVCACVCIITCIQEENLTNMLEKYRSKADAAQVDIEGVQVQMQVALAQCSEAFGGRWTVGFIICISSL